MVLAIRAIFARWEGQAELRFEGEPRTLGPGESHSFVVNLPPSSDAGGPYAVAEGATVQIGARRQDVLDSAVAELAAAGNASNYIYNITNYNTTIT